MTILINGIKKEKTMSRASILKAIKENKPTLVALPEIDLDFFSEAIDLMETFRSNVELVGGNVFELEQIGDLDAEINRIYPNAQRIVSLVEGSGLGNVHLNKETDPHDLGNVDLSIINGEFGVAENGAVWISETHFPIRVLPFITNDLVIVLSKKELCLHMHDAYRLIVNRERNFGLFLSGPSKTADIEQCLVIGAHGAMSLTILLV